MTQFEQYLRQVHARVSQRSFQAWFRDADPELLIQVADGYAESRFFAGQREMLDTMSDKAIKVINEMQ